MADLPWDEVKGWFDLEWNGSLPDGVVRDTSIDDWNLVLSLARERGWKLEYHDQDQVLAVPTDLAGAFGVDWKFQPRLVLWPGSAMFINFWPFSPGTVDFDFDLHDVQDQNGLDWLCAFVRCLGTQLGKPVEIMPEGFDQKPFLVFDPHAGRFATAGAP